MNRMLSHEQARRCYDQVGARQDPQGGYEDVAIATMRAHAALSTAEAVIEFGCGTGKLA